MVGLQCEPRAKVAVAWATGILCPESFVLDSACMAETAYTNNA